MQLSQMARLPASLLSLLLLSRSSLVGAATARSLCVRSDVERWAAAAACGDAATIQHCLLNDITDPDDIRSADLAQCFQDAGCTIAESVIEAAHILKSCDHGSSVAELRRRIPAPIPEPTPMAAPQDPPPPPPQESAPPAPTPPAITVTDTCSSQTSVMAQVCDMYTEGPMSGKKSACSDALVATAVCRADKVCKNDVQGSRCRTRVDSVDLSGIIVGSFLGVLLALSLAVFIFFCTRDKRNQRKMRAQKEAEDIVAQQASFVRKRPSMATTMASGEPDHASGHGNGNGDGDGNGNPLQQNPFSDVPGR